MKVLPGLNNKKKPKRSSSLIPKYSGMPTNLALRKAADDVSGKCWWIKAYLIMQEQLNYKLRWKGGRRK